MERILVVFVTVAVMLGGIPAAAQSSACNQEMLRGVWCETCTGFTDLSKVNPNVPKGTLVPFSMLVRHVINSEGKGTGTGFASLAGSVNAVEVDTTLTVNSGCLGQKTYAIRTKSGGNVTGKAGVVFMPSGQEINVLIQEPGDVVSCKLKKMLQHTLID